jgi:alginate O-acetyltransferase complex protein AlgJ
MTVPDEKPVTPDPPIAGAAAASPVAYGMVFAFLAIVFGVPLWQGVVEGARGEIPQSLDVFRRRLRVERIREFERTLEERAYLRRLTAPFAADLLGRLGNVNNLIHVGPDRRPYIRPSLEHVFGPGILDPRRAERRAAEGRDGFHSPAVFDPRPTLVDFHRECGRRGIRLVLLIVPEKTTTLRPGVGPGQVADNPDIDRFLAELRAAGVDVFYGRDFLDPAAPAHLDYDTHWTPEWMESLAAMLAAKLRPMLPPGAAPAPATVIREVTDSVVGDVFRANPHLRMQEGRFPPMALRLREVRRPDGEPWRPDPAADVLLIGDSNSTVFSTPDTGSDCAGFGPHLSRLLNRPVDALVAPGLIPRQVQADLRRDPARLRGKRLVIWQFAARMLTAHAWPPILDPAAGEPSTPPDPRPAGNAVVIAELLTPVPEFDPTKSPYADALVVLKFQVRSVVSGKYGRAEVLVALPLLTGRRFLPAATLRPGRTYRLTLEPAVPAAMRTWQRLDRTNEFDLPELFAAEAVEQR